MKEYTFDRSVDATTPAPQPHFDDEQTLLSAQPVVPLEKIEAKVRSRRRWFLGGAFAIAMMLGAASALVASYLKLRNVPNSVSEVSQEEVTPEPVAVAEAVPTDSPVVENVAEESPAVEEETTASVTPPRETSVRRRTVMKHIPDLEEPRNTRGVDEDQELNRIREAILFDEWQERRARRATRRERRNRIDRYNDRDLSNLDEIFEGRRRRPN